MRTILFTKPVFKEMIWGGNRLQTEYGYAIPSDHTGECWAVSAHPNGDCVIYTPEGGTEYDGRLLSSLWEEHRELFGNEKGEVFPLLTKIIDAKADLSIQVHPDDCYADKNENGSLGKTECWYILDCDPDAEIVIGHHAATKKELAEMIAEGRWNELIAVQKIQPGDFFQINPGTVHAIKKGTLLLETQQSSDVTYRLYDYDRLQNGKPRELHIEKSIDVVQCPAPRQTGKDERRKEVFPDGSAAEELIQCDFYKVNHLTVKERMVRKQEASFEICSVTAGQGSIDGVELKKGDHFILPSGYGTYELCGSMELICSTL